MRDMLNNKTVTHLGNLALSGTTPAASAWVDLRGFDACTLVAVANTVTDAGTAAGFTLSAQHADDTADASAAPIVADDSVNSAIDIDVTLDTADDAVVGAIGYVGNKRYLRINGVGTTGTNADVSILAIKNKPHRAKTTLIGTSVAAT